MKKKGFSLIELLIVVAIIAILATLAVIALQSSRARARDSKRLGDVKQITTALALYQHDAGIFPATMTPGMILTYNGNTYMEIVPAPPTPDDGCTGSTEYTYTSSAGNTYNLRYCLGSASSDVPVGLNTATPAGIKSAR